MNFRISSYLMVPDSAVGSLATHASARVDASSVGAGRGRRAVTVVLTLCLGLTSLARRRVAVSDLPVPTCAFVAALHVNAFGALVARVAGATLVDVDAETVGLGLLVAVLTVADRLVVLSAAGAAAALNVLARIWTEEHLH
jgi:hypothetical protein